MQVSPSFLCRLLRPVMPVLVMCGGLALVTPSQALIHGMPFPALAISTVKLSIQHEHYLRSMGTWEYYDSMCSAVIVGRQPLTLLTAAHCLKEVKLTGPKELPDVTIAQAQSLGIEALHLRQAFYRPYEEVSEDVTKDLAILVFDAELHGGVQPVRIHLKEKLPDSLMICGYGRGYQEEDTRQPRCAERAQLRDLSDFYQVLPQTYEAMDEMLHIKARAQFDYTKELVHAEKALLAVNRLGTQSQYDHHLAMPTVGDSGGPWMLLNARGQYELVAITSLVERFYNKSQHWSFFDRDAPLSDFPYIAYGLKLNHPEVLAFLQYARNSGADIQFVLAAPAWETEVTLPPEDNAPVQ